MTTTKIAPTPPDLEAAHPEPAQVDAIDETSEWIEAFDQVVVEEGPMAGGQLLSTLENWSSLETPVDQARGVLLGKQALNGVTESL